MLFVETREFDLVGLMLRFLLETACATRYFVLLSLEVEREWLHGLLAWCARGGCNHVGQSAACSWS